MNLFKNGFKFKKEKPLLVTDPHFYNTLRYRNAFHGFYLGEYFYEFFHCPYYSSMHFGFTTRVNLFYTGTDCKDFSEDNWSFFRKDIRIPAEDWNESKYKIEQEAYNVDIYTIFKDMFYGQNRFKDQLILQNYGKENLDLYRQGAYKLTCNITSADITTLSEDFYVRARLETDFVLY